MNILFPYMARWKAVNWTRYHQILTRLAEQGHQIYVFQPPRAELGETNFDEIEVELPENLHLEEIPVSQKIWNVKLPFEKLFKKGYVSVKSHKILKAYIKEKNIDVLLIYNIPQYSFLSFKNVITVFDFADDYIAMLEHELGCISNTGVLSGAKYILNQMIKKADITLAVSNVLADKYKDSGMIVLPNGVDISKYQPGIGKDLKKTYPGTVIGFIGSFEYFINFDLILDAARNFSKHTFLMVGGGRRLNEIKEKVSAIGLDNVVFTGGLPHAELMRHVDIMDICLNTFTKDPISHGACPIKLFEYMAMNKPVISTRVEEVEYIDNGSIYFADNGEEMIRMTNSVLNDVKLRDKKVALGRKLVEDQYNWGNIADRFVEIVENKQSDRD